jgi:phosphoribosylformylglycinamidine cyclo-ligase
MSDPAPPRPPARNGLTYRDAGVDIDAGEALVDRIGPAAAATKRPGVMGALGGFGAMFDLKAAGFADPILVAATDGIGTKLRLGLEAGRLRGLGQDLVAMCVNDLICQGAEPLFFLDYFATGRLDVAAAAEVIEGVAEACREAGCALIGGETAEMPGLYAPGDFDAAGFAVGAMERGAQLPRPAAPGDVLLACASSGPHSNGFSLIRRILEVSKADLTAPAPWDGSRTLAEALLAPTRLYPSAAKAALQAAPDALKAFAHVTGGGLTDNLPRVLADGQGARVDLSARPLPPVFAWLQDAGGVEDAELRRVFNCGVGLVAVISPDAAETVAQALAGAGEDVWTLGEITSTPGIAYA